MLVPSECNEKNILSDEVFEQIITEEDPVNQAKSIIAFQNRAKELDDNLKTRDRHYVNNFNRLLKQWQKLAKESAETKKNPSKEDNYTNFDYFGNGIELKCGSWVADDKGVKGYNLFGEVLACYHPILPIERLENLETGEEQIVLAFKRGNKWKVHKVPKDVISSATKITALSRFGVAVTSENARHLVRFLSDIENWNEGLIQLRQSTSKLGWLKDDFIPYDKEITFDGDNRFKQIFEALHERGDVQTWTDHIKELRASGKFEVKFILAASFASILIKIVGGLPFFVDLWGETEGGKTVTLMLAASVWGNPGESQYIGDFKTTDVALEAKADMLNNLPMILDDTSKTSARIRDNFEAVVYDLCSGKGKSRSNRDLGINRENHWSNCIICNGERPLNSYVNQGGAINRIIEVKCSSHIFTDPQCTANILKRNYGFVGKLFVETVKNMGEDTVREVFNGFLKQLMSEDRMQKQAMSVATVLTADKIVTDEIFKDGQYITLEEAEKVLIDRNEVSDNERCYEYILEKVAQNPKRFEDDSNQEIWGKKDDDMVTLIRSAFDGICRDGGFNSASFLEWADYHKLLVTDPGRRTKVVRINGERPRCICLKTNRDEDSNDTEEVFETVDDLELPFND